MWVEINEMTEGAQRDTRRTADAAATAETLSARRRYGAATECRARLGNVGPHGARSGRKVGKVVNELQGLRVCRVVVSRGTRLE